MASDLLDKATRFRELLRRDGDCQRRINAFFASNGRRGAVDRDANSGTEEA